MASHVFVTKGDLSKLRCNAWLLPTDANLQIDLGWRLAAPEEHKHFERRLAKPPGWDNSGLRTLRLAPWYAALDHAPAPIPVLTNVIGAPSTAIEWYIEGVRQFAVASRDTRTTAKTWRERPLFGVPFVGAGPGETGAKLREIAARLATSLQDIAETHDVDIAVVVKDDAAYTAMQEARPARAWMELSEPLLAAATDLARRALEGDLAVFIGAGVSRPAGLPTGRQLIDDIAAEAGLSDIERRALAELSPLDGAAILDSRLAARGSDLKTLVAERFTIASYSLAHTLVASLGLRASATTNYDRLYETAAADVGNHLSVLPHAPLPGAHGWLLKLHGSVEFARDMIVTRQDDLRYESLRAALQGTIQALLIARHIFFVGFSLTDDTFHSLSDAVRRAMTGHPRAPGPDTRFGTVLLTNGHGLSNDLFGKELTLVSTGADNDPAGKTSPLQSGRRAEIFLDCLAFKATTPVSHILDDRYRDFLGEGDAAVKTMLDDLAKALPPAAGRSAAYGPIVKLLKRFGAEL